MAEKCPECDGTGKIPKPIGMREMGEVDCDLCEGTGFLPEDPDKAVIARLDKIIDLLEKKRKPFPLCFWERR